MTELSRPLPSYLRERYKAWRAIKYEENRSWYQRLANTGQHPRAMIVACCDSRLDIVQLFGGEPGDLFVVRNVGNLIPPHVPDHNHHGTSAAVQFAVTELMVAHIIVVGHSDCGAIHACHDMCAGLAPELDKSESYIGRWMDILRPGYDKVVEKVPEDGNRLTALEKEGVLTSISNLLTFPFVKEAVETGDLTLHGCWMNIGTGKLNVYDYDTNMFV